MNQAVAEENEFLYQRIAGELARAIRQGVYGVGERMPSLRRVAGHFDVSLATVVLAFQQLEDEGLLAARAKSGFYVRPWGDTPGAAPEISRPKQSATRVNVGQLALSLVSEAKSAKLTKLGAAVPAVDLLPVRALGRAMAAAARNHWRETAVYESAVGVLALRRQIARLMRQAGLQCTPEDIVITNGALEALMLSLRVMTRPGDTVVIESPTYFGVLQVMESLGLKALEVATHPDTGIDIDALSHAVKNKSVRACVLMPNFANPTGASMPERSKREAVALLEKAGVPLIEDDVYGTLSYKQPRPKAAKAYDKSGKAIVCSSFSKTVAPGYRIGWIVAGIWRQQIEYYKFLDNISTATLPQLALADFLARGGYTRCVQQNVKIYQRRMEQLRHLLARYLPKGTRVSNPSGGFVLWVELPSEYDCMDIYQRAMSKKLAISPGVLFGARGQYQHHLRLSCGVLEGAELREAIKLLARCIDDSAAV